MKINRKPNQNLFTIINYYSYFIEKIRNTLRNNLILCFIFKYNRNIISNIHKMFYLNIYKCSLNYNYYIS